MALPNTQYDVVLVHPPADALVEYLDAPDFPNIGIAYLGDYLEKHLSVTPALLDARLARLSLNETLDQIVSLRPRMVGITAMTHMINMAAALAKGVRERLPGARLILGGVHATFLPEQTLKEFPQFDIVVVGEGEIPLARLVESLLNGGDYKSIEGLCFSNNGVLINNGRAKPVEDLNELGKPAWHLFDQEVVRKYCRKIPIITSRGCPFKCNFCSRPYGQKFRKRRADLVVEEMAEHSAQLSLRHFWFFDENFSLDKKKIEELCLDLLDKRLDFTWETSVHVNTIDRQVAGLMKQAGCFRVGFGVESGNEQIIRSMGKGITKRRVLEAHKLLKKEGFITTSFFILGHPGETRKTIWDTIRFAVQLNADQTSIAIVVPYPGTQVWELALQGRGGYRKLSPKWSDYNKLIGNAIEIEGISRREMEILQMLGIGFIFLFNLRFHNLWIMFRENEQLVLKILKKIFSPVAS